MSEKQQEKQEESVEDKDGDEDNQVEDAKEKEDFYNFSSIVARCC